MVRAQNMRSKEASINLFWILHSDSEYGLLLLIHILCSYLLNVTSEKIGVRQIGSVEFGGMSKW